MPHNGNLIHPCTVGLRPAVHDYLARYFGDGPHPHLLPIDIILALLRSSCPECVAAAERLSGVRVQRCAPRTLVAPPRVQPQPRVKYVRTTPPPGRGKWLGTQTIERLRSVRVGMTMDQLRTRGWSTYTVWWAGKCGLMEVA